MTARLSRARAHSTPSHDANHPLCLGELRRPEAPFEGDAFRDSPATDSRLLRHLVCQRSCLPYRQNRVRLLAHDSWRIHVRHEQGADRTRIPCSRIFVSQRKHKQLPPKFTRHSRSKSSRLWWARRENTPAFETPKVTLDSTKLSEQFVRKRKFIDPVPPAASNTASVVVLVVS